MKRLLALLLLVAGLGAAWAGRVRTERLAFEPSPEQELLYLPNARYLRAISAGQAAILADLVYLWSIQYYSNYERADRFRYVEHVYGEVIPELNPHYLDPYWLGALVLSIEARDLEAALRLLDQGLQRNPDQWLLPFTAAWECAHAGRYERAIEYFEKAAAIPEAPAGFILRMRAGMFKRAGDLRAAIEGWREVLADPRSDASAREIAQRQIRDLTVRADIADLTRLVEGFHEAHGRIPRGLEELVRAGVLRGVPLDPDGNPYVLDRRTGEVSSAAVRLLGS